MTKKELKFYKEVFIAAIKNEQEPHLADCSAITAVFKLRQAAKE